MKAINRFIRYCDFKGVKPSRFEKDFGISNGYFSVQLKRNGSLGEDTLKIIIDNCHDIDPEWLLSGNGNMLKSEFQKGENSDFENNKDKEIERLKDKINDLQIINELLTRTVADLDNRNSTVKYLDREHDLFANVAEPESELKKEPKK